MARDGLLVDWGGVLTTDLFASFAAFCEAESIDPGTVRDLLRHDEAARSLLVALECGTVAEPEFERRFAPMLGVAPGGLIDRLFAGSDLDRAMIAAVRAARDSGIATGLVSNSWGVDRYPHELLEELFDGVVLSGTVGIRKPAIEIYVMGAEAIGLPPEQCVYVDDLGFNLKPARTLGMATVLHSAAATTIAELEGQFGIPLSVAGAS